jgi:hypothetical protein
MVASIKHVFSPSKLIFRVRRAVSPVHGLADENPPGGSHQQLDYQLGELTLPFNRRSGSQAKHFLRLAQ